MFLETFANQNSLKPSSFPGDTQQSDRKLYTIFARKNAP